VLTCILKPLAYPSHLVLLAFVIDGMIVSKLNPTFEHFVVLDWFENNNILFTFDIFRSWIQLPHYKYQL
jgi:hypothetical protein